MKAALLTLLEVVAFAATTGVVAAVIAILIFDQNCVLALCGLEGLVYGGLVIWAALFVGGLVSLRLMRS